jgi:hypothetical protein
MIAIRSGLAEADTCAGRREDGFRFDKNVGNPISISYMRHRIWMPLSRRDKNHLAQGCPPRATLGNHVQHIPNPNGVESIPDSRNPFLRNNCWVMI